MDPPSGYRNDSTTGIAVGDDPETIYAVFNGTHYNDRCCFDYGNAETNNLDDGATTMEALYFGNANGGLNHGGRGKGPWIMADMENAHGRESSPQSPVMCSLASSAEPASHPLSDSERIDWLIDWFGFFSLTRKRSIN